METNERSAEAAMILQSLRYDPETGVFTWREDRPAEHYKRPGYYQNYLENRAGREVEFGVHKTYGYFQVGIGKRSYQAQTLAYVLMNNGYFPKEGYSMDHINGDTQDNRWVNLRCVPITLNMRNRRMFSNNSSGINGVCWVKSRNKWQAQARDAEGRVIFLGRFDDLEGAAKARRAWDDTNDHLGYTDRHGKDINMCTIE